MKETNKSIKAIKQLFREIADHRNDPTKISFIKQNRIDIAYNLKLYNYSSDEDFAKEHSFCTDCGSCLNENNDCPGCGKEFGW